MTTKLQPMTADAEHTYDTVIAPLMTKIIAACREHRIPMLAMFEFAPENFCTTAIPFDGMSPRFDFARTALTTGTVLGTNLNREE